MPIYEYKCLNCDARLEKMQKVSDAPLKICEKCGGKLEKQLSLSAFQFKGAGWYITDYSKKSNGSKDEKSPPAESTVTSETASKETKSSAVSESSD